MPYIKVDTKKLATYGNVVSSTRGSVSNIQSSFYSIGNSLDWDVKDCADINRRIRQINNELTNEIASLKRMESFFQMAVSKYNAAEKEEDKLPKIPKIMRLAPRRISMTKNNTNVALLSILKSNNISTAKQVNISDKCVEKVKDLLFDIVKKTGVVGSVIGIVDSENSVINKIREGDYIDAVSKFSKMAKNTYKTVSKLTKKVTNMAKVSPMLHWSTQAKSWGKTLLGFENYFNPKTVGVASKASKTTTRIYNNFQKTITHEFGNITKSDVVISGIIRGIDNIGEWRKGEITWDRAIAETITETAIDVVLDAALTAGVAAILAGIAGTTAVPAIAIAAVTVTAKWFLDTVTNAVTGTDDGFIEFVSDGLIDMGQTIEKYKKKATSAVVSHIRNACINTFGKNCFGTVTNAVSSLFVKRRSFVF